MEKTLQQWFDELIAVNSDGLQQINGAINKILQFRSEKIAAEHQPTPSEEETTSDCDSVMDTVSQEPEPEPTTTPPSTDDGFQTVPQKRKRKEQTSAAQDPTPKKVSGNPLTGTNWRRTAPVPPAPQTQPQEGDPEPARKPRVPPVIIRDSGKWTEVSKLLSSAKIHVIKARQCAEGIRVQFAGSNEFRAATRLLENKRVPFHTFTLQEEKSVRVVLKPVPREIPVEEIAEDLEAQGFHPIGVHRMRRLISKKELPLVLVELPPSEKNIFELKTVCFLTVNVEKPRRNGWVSQCHNCQWFHHSQRNCRAAPRCVKCGKDHSSNTCGKSKETPAICANCGGSHTASYRGCCKFPQPKNAPAKLRQQQKPKPPSENDKSKSAPEIAPQVNSTRTEDKTATSKTATRSSTFKTDKSFAQAATSAKPATSAPTEKFDGLSAALVEAVTAIGTAKNGTEAIQHFVSFIPKLTAILTTKS
jgi:hypothetical protein